MISLSTRQNTKCKQNERRRVVGRHESFEFSYFAVTNSFNTNFHYIMKCFLFNKKAMQMEFIEPETDNEDDEDDRKEKRSGDGFDD